MDAYRNERVLSIDMIGFHNTFKLHNEMNGAFAFRVSGDGQMLKVGRILVVK